MRIRTREALIGLIVYRILRFMILRRLSEKGGGIMASGKKVGIVAAIVAGLGALMFWRKKKKSGGGGAEAI